MLLSVWLFIVPDLSTVSTIPFFKKKKTKHQVRKLIFVLQDLERREHH